MGESRVDRCFVGFFGEEEVYDGICDGIVRYVDVSLKGREK